jgi:hypothetical protein
MADATPGQAEQHRLGQELHQSALRLISPHDAFLPGVNGGQGAVGQV